MNRFYCRCKHDSKPKACSSMQWVCWCACMAESRTLRPVPVQNESHCEARPAISRFTHNCCVGVRAKIKNHKFNNKRAAEKWQRRRPRWRRQWRWWQKKTKWQIANRCKRLSSYDKVVSSDIYKKKIVVDDVYYARSIALARALVPCIIKLWETACSWMNTYRLVCNAHVNCATIIAF